MTDLNGARARERQGGAMKKIFLALALNVIPGLAALAMLALIALVLADLFAPVMGAMR